MKKQLIKWILGACATVAGLSVAACDPGASCESGCEESDDCAAGLVCRGIVGKGNICVPDECKACFEAGQSCAWDNDNGESSSCEFVQCS